MQAKELALHALGARERLDGFGQHPVGRVAGRHGFAPRKERRPKVAFSSISGQLLTGSQRGMVGAASGGFGGSRVGLLEVNSRVHAESSKVAVEPLVSTFAPEIAQLLKETP